MSHATDSTALRETAPILEVRDAHKSFRLRTGVFGQQFIKAVDGVSFAIDGAHTLGLVGESGCGKSTLARLILGLETLTDGDIYFRGASLAKLSLDEYADYRSSVHAVVQDPYSSLNPRMRVHSIVAEPLRSIREMDAGDRRKRVTEVIKMVGLPADAVGRYPHEFSGGQRQRIAIARAIAARPALIVLDEAVSALDVSIRAQIINLLRDLRDELDTSYLFISHDLHVVEYMSDVVAVMYLGKIVEMTSKEELLENRLHPYTQALFSALLRPDPDDPRGDVTAEGEPPDPVNPPPGCPFHPRCPIAEARCATDVPPLREVRRDHFAACHLA